MPNENPLGERGRVLEDDYFRKKDRELIEKMRQASAAEAASRELSAKSGLRDPEMLEELQALGFTPDTVALLPLVPLLQMAWAEGGVSEAERTLILQLAGTRGIEDGSAADRQLRSWLSSRPDAQVFSSASRLIRATLDSEASGVAPLTADDLVKYCEQIAAASGGIFGIGRVSSEERALLDTIARDLAHKK
ncbi:MAG: hypothetical protein ABL986_08475 [Vicinamibacterales bacterium]